jgi:hypothetical protein
MMGLISSVFTWIMNFGESSLEHPSRVVVSGFCTVILSAALSTTEFAGQYPGIMITIISTIGAFCLVLIGVIYSKQMNVNTEVLAGLKELRIEIKQDRESAQKERESIRKEKEKMEAKLELKIDAVRKEVHKAEVIQAENRNAEHINTKSEVETMRQTLEAMKSFMDKLKNVELVRIHKNK